MAKLRGFDQDKLLAPNFGSSDGGETEQQSRSGGTRAIVPLHEVLMDSELADDSERFELMSCSSDVNSQIMGDRFIPRRCLDFGEGSGIAC